MISVEVKGLREAEVAISSLGRELKQGYAKFFQGVLSGQFTKYAQERFDTEGEKYGARWAPLTARTLHTSRHVRRGGILYRFGRLRQSFISPSAPGSVETVKPFEYLRGSSVRYAIFHQEGTRRMPARPILVIPDSLANLWLKMLGDYTDEQIRKADLS